jgi:hypothetical protein
MRDKVDRRLSALERAAAPTSSAPPIWVSVATEAAAASYRGVKVYVGVSPDDWDADHETGTATAQRA